MRIVKIAYEKTFKSYLPEAKPYSLANLFISDIEGDTVNNGLWI
jgi:hypothetical protein